MNVKVTLSYDGSKYLGSQRQPNKQSVEDKILEVLDSLNIETNITLSGRTDKGVHASGQVFNMKIPEYWNNLEKLKKILNQQLPSSIRINKIKEVGDEFHSRFHAKKRVYRYIVSTKKENPFENSYVTFLNKIDEDSIKKAITIFEGTHDFEYFHKRGSDKENLVRTIYKARFYRYKNYYIFYFEANSYLRSQIRLMVAFLLKISDAKLSNEDLKNQLNKEKMILKTPAPAEGLYLAKIKF